MKTIIIFATKYGCVENAVGILKSMLPGEVKQVNIMKDYVPSLDNFDHVIIGGSIYVGKIQKKLSKFVDKNLSILLTKQIGLFICAGEKKEDIRVKELVDSFPNELLEHAVCKDVLGYEIHVEKLNFLEKKMVAAVLGHKNSCSELSIEKIKKFAEIISK